MDDQEILKRYADGEGNFNRGSLIQDWVREFVPDCLTTVDDFSMARGFDCR